LSAAAILCTDFSRANDFDAVKKLLRPAADLIDAIGLIVWMGTPEGADLRPLLWHGYPARAVAQMAPVPRSGENAVAAAYRTGTIQTVWTPGSGTAAVVAPLLIQEGCIGALAAEVRSGRESSSETQSLASIVAAQLAGLLSGSAAAPAEQPRERAAGA
jgi:hypothetical protein